MLLLWFSIIKELGRSILVLHTNYDYHECARPGTDNRYDREPILLTGLTGIFYDHEYPLSSWYSYGSLNYQREELVHRFIICTEELDGNVITPCLSQVVGVYMNVEFFMYISAWLDMEFMNLLVLRLSLVSLWNMEFIILRWNGIRYSN